MVEENFDKMSTEETVWKSMRRKDITKRTRLPVETRAHGIYGLGASGSIFLDAEVEQSALYVTNKAPLSI